MKKAKKSAKAVLRAIMDDTIDTREKSHSNSNIFPFEFLETLMLAINDSAMMNEEQENFFFQIACNGRYDTEKTTSENEYLRVGHQWILQIATYVNSCR